MESAVLGPGKAVDREIHGGETQELRLPVRADQYLRLRFEQRGVKATGDLAGPGGEILARAGDPGRRFWRERLVLITGSAGELRWILKSPEAETGGRYIIEVEELRPVRPEDGDRVAAERALEEGLRIAIQNTREARQHALIRLREALALWEKVGDPIRLVDTLAEISSIEVEDEAGGASASAKKARALAHAAGYRKGEAKALLRLGSAQSRDKKRSEARDSLEEALRLSREEGDRQTEGKVLRLLGIIATYSLDLDKAVEYLSQSLPFLRATGEAGSEATARASLAWILLNQGKIEITEAYDLFQQALTLARDAGDPSAEASVLYNSLIPLQRISGDLEQALINLEKVLEINRRLGERGYEPILLNSLGSISCDLAQLESAAEQYKRALEVSRELGDSESEARAQANLGWVYQLQENPSTALDQYRLVLSRQDTLSPNVKALVLYYMGAAYNALDRPEEALTYLTQSLNLREETGTLGQQAQTRLETGKAYRQQGDASRAAEHFQRALQLSESSKNEPLKVAVLYHWALLDRDQGELHQAREKMEQVLRSVESLRSRVTREALRTSFFVSKRDQYELYVDILMRLHTLEPEGGHLATALAASERARARSLLDLLAEGQVDLRQGVDPSLKRREADLGARLTFIQSQLGSSQIPPERISKLQEQLEQGLEEVQGLQEDIRNRSPRYAQVRYPQPLDLQKIQALLDNDTVLLQYFAGEDRSFLFAVTREIVQGFAMPSSKELARQVGQFRSLLRERGRRRLHQYREEAFALYTTLLSPAAQILAGKRHLLISPDGPLHFLPFEALLTHSADGDYRDLPYLLLEHAVSYTPSASVLASLREPRPEALSQPQRRFIAFADPVYGAEPMKTASARPLRGGQELQRLEGSGREVGDIAKLYSPEEVQVYLRESANEANVKRNPLLKKAERVHFATHGFLDETHPWLSGLELTSGPGPEEDGKLQVYEIFNLELETDLLVLSACETGLGETIKGEGIVGLTRAFFYAGARSLVVSLWPVDDSSTPDLMVSFYKGLGQSSKAEALRRSKIAMIESGYANPFFWAPFTLIGNSD